MRAEPGAPCLHEDKVRFLDAVNATAAATGFGARLVEKDYFCTLLLQSLAPPGGALVFKGGTCLAKVHTDFYRLSEDLDFTIPTPVDASRGQRSRRARDLKALVAGIDRRWPGVHLRRPIEGANNSTQYVAVFGYASLLRATEESIQFEVSLREPLLTDPVQGEAKTLLLNPISGSSMVPGVRVPTLSWDETMAEKIRAALCRKDAAIRDFYDIDHAVRNMGVRLDDRRLLGLVRQKVAVPGTNPPDTSRDRLRVLGPQVDARLEPVLRPADLARFNLDRAFGMLTDLVASL